MGDFSMERLEPATRVPEVQGKPKRDPDPRPRRRPDPTESSAEEGEEAEIPRHELDRLG